MKKLFGILALAAMSSLGYGQFVVNPSFELAPPYTGWTVTGDANIWTSANGIDPRNGTRYAQMSTAETAGAVSAAIVESFLSLSAGTLATQGGGTVGDGSAIKQVNITVGAADVGKSLTFDWNLLTTGTLSATERDYGYPVPLVQLHM